MGLNSNAKGLKSQRRLDREIYRREETPWRDTFWKEEMLVEMTDDFLRRCGAGERLWPHHAVCGHCWEIVTSRDTMWDIDHDGRVVHRLDESDPHPNSWVHTRTQSRRCAKRKLTHILPLPGILVIEELTL